MAFAERHRQGVYLEAMEIAIRAAMHQAGASVLEELLNTQMPPEPEVACGCGQKARLHQMRPKQILTALGRIRIERAYYICSHCHHGQSPVDRQLDVEGTEYSPAVRRMMAIVGSEGSFDQGREQLADLAGLEVTAKAVERQAETIGQDIANREQARIEPGVDLTADDVRQVDGGRAGAVLALHRPSLRERPAARRGPPGVGRGDPVADMGVSQTSSARRSGRRRQPALPADA